MKSKRNFDVILGATRYLRVCKAEDTTMTIDEAMTDSFPGIWNGLNDFKKVWFIKQQKIIGTVDNQNNIVPDKFYQKKYQIENLIRQISQMKDDDFTGAQNQRSTLNNPYFKPDLQW